MSRTFLLLILSFFVWHAYSHRYIFENHTKVSLQELGPRFTVWIYAFCNQSLHFDSYHRIIVWVSSDLIKHVISQLKLRSLQRGTYDAEFPEYEWVHKVRNAISVPISCFSHFECVHVIDGHGHKSATILSVSVCFGFTGGNFAMHSNRWSNQLRMTTNHIMLHIGNVCAADWFNAVVLDTNEEQVMVSEDR